MAVKADKQTLDLAIEDTVAQLQRVHSPHPLPS
jgi:hypothetical protein